ncbi:HAD-IIIA family hydrolase [Arthrobacter echini]|uniref:D,D-heptose 1,7-bisphosphate phosphatase n=1 Tax=Arthrobacter echini TaxID=1529066 RepID=A0A4S5E475_9MICC|nr:HAD-IIIA family hydrolase [Arthrobacter echini]THJ66248.1 HAD-IIIA family hydrolase [Arthrobacter echini]
MDLSPGRPRTAPRAVLFDRDGTIVRDVPYNGDPSLVEPMPGARTVLEDLRSRGVRVGVVTNQSGIARGLVTREQVDAVNARVEDLLGPFDVWEVCPHGTADGCACRKPRPGMILSASDRLQLDPVDVAVIGDIGADMGAAAAAGARAVLVPTSVTLVEEIQAAPAAAGTLSDAVAMLWEGRA